MKAIDIKNVYDNQAESGVLATLINNPSFINYSENLKPNYFFHKENGCIYWAILELNKNGVRNIDSFNLETMLNSNNAIKNTMSGYLSGVSSETQTQTNVKKSTMIDDIIELSTCISRDTPDEYKILVNKIIELSFKRDLFSKLKNMQEKCTDDSLNILSIYKYINNNIDNLISEYVINENIQTVGEKIDDIWQEICDRRTSNGLYGIPSKFKTLNNYLTYEPEELIIISGQMKKGKSVFMMEEALHKVKNGIMTAYFDTEMTDRLFTERMISNISGVEMRKIKSGNYTSSEEKLIEEALKLIKSTKFIHIYDPVWTYDKIYSTVKYLINNFDLQFLVYDYIKDNTENQYNKLGEMTDFLHNEIAGNTGISVIAGAQLNRGGEIADSIKIDRYTSARISWDEKTADEIDADGGVDYGNYRARVELNRIGDFHKENEYINFYFDGSRMKIIEAKQNKSFSI